MDTHRCAYLKRCTWVAALAVVALATVSFLFFDRPAAWFAHGVKGAPVHDWAKQLSLLANHTLIFSFTAVGLALSALNLTGSSPRPWARKLMYVCLSVLAAISFTESIKYVMGRCRPELLFSQDLYGFTWFSGEYVRNSFPSGHTTRIFALCMSVSLLYRKLAIPVLSLAALVGASRVFALKHYPSDVLAGAFIGVFVASWAYVIWQSNNTRG